MLKSRWERDAKTAENYATHKNAEICFVHVNESLKSLSGSYPILIKCMTILGIMDSRDLNSS